MLARPLGYMLFNQYKAEKNIPKIAKEIFEKGGLFGEELGFEKLILGFK